MKRQFRHFSLVFLLIMVLSACEISPEREALFATVSGRDEPAVENTSSIAAVGDPIKPTGALVVSPTTVIDKRPEEQTVSPPEDIDVTPETSNISDPRGSELHAYLEQLASSGQFMGSVLIAQGGDVILSQGYGMADIARERPNTAQTQLRVGSITKQFTAAAIMLLLEQGKLDVHDPVSHYLPDYPGGDQMTIHQLLTHTAGVPNYTRRQDLAQVVQSPVALDDLLGSFAGQPLDFPPGQQFAYSDSGYVVLTAIIEAASRMPYADFIQTRIFDTVGMSDSGYDYLHDGLDEPAVGYQLTPGGPRQAVDTESSWPSGAGALYSTTQDLYAWDRALKDDQFLSDASLVMMFTPWADMGKGYHYGYGWELGRTAGRPSQTHAGTIFGFASFIARFPEDDATIIILSNGLQLSPRQIAKNLAAIMFSS